MGAYYIKSIIGEIAKGVELFIKRGIISREQRVILYGLDRYSFAMRTILSNLGYCNVEGYVSDDEALVVQYKSEIKNFACRFLNQESNVINVWTLEERLQPFDSKAVILLAAEDYRAEMQKLEAMGYQEGVHYYIVYDFGEEELNCYFAGKPLMTLPEIKETEKQMLAYVDGICRKNNLRYWVCGGTLLGTIRHKGFIPWDDDIDIFLPWKDYLKLIDIFEETDRFDMIGFGTARVNDFPDLLAKVVDKRTVINENIGTVRKINPLWVDIFPLIGLPDDAEERHLFFTNYKELNRRIWQEFYATNGSLDVFSKWFVDQKKFLSAYDFDSASYAGVLGTIYGEKDSTGRKVYDKTLRMQFEDIEVNVPAGYKEYLDNLYGKDWMQLPDEEKRKSHHNILAYWNQ
ncbi:MAG TPA: hypothetical protein DCZ40_00320 [Lachnospiraceae bacterium]|nr:hypothetical protein [Lachnospiraceae bacterium]